MPEYFLGSPLWLIYLAITLINVAISFVSVVSGTLVMDFTKTGSEGVDCSLQMTAIHAGGLGMAAISGIYGLWEFFHLPHRPWLWTDFAYSHTVSGRTGFKKRKIIVNVPDSFLPTVPQ